MDYQATNRKFTERGMRIASIKEVRDYKKMMKSQGIKVIVDIKGRKFPKNMAAGFEYTTGEIFIKKHPTLLSLHHEGLHAKQWLDIGQEAYEDLGRLAREEYVYKNIFDSGMFNEVELAYSKWYMELVRRMEGGR